MKPGWTSIIRLIFFFAMFNPSRQIFLSQLKKFVCFIRLPHRGYGYKASNYRSFVYVDVVGIKRATDATQKIWLTKSKLRPRYYNNGKWRAIDLKDAKQSLIGSTFLTAIKM